MISRNWLVVTLGTAGMVGMSAGAFAADVMPVKATPKAVAAVYNWTGFYVGANAGVGVAGTQVTAFGNNISDNRGDTIDLFRSGFTGGVQAGFNWQFAPNLVAGVEADIGVLNTNRLACNFQYCGQGGGGDFIVISSRSDSFSTVRGRLGYAWDRYLAYVTGGAAWMRVRDSWTDLDLAVLREQTRTLSGTAFGGGLEAALWGNWTAKVEYLHINMGTHRVADPDAHMDFRHRYHVARAGLNYRFGPVGDAGALSANAAARPAPAAPYNWTGLYIGLNGGASVAGTALSNAEPVNNGFLDMYSAGITGGVQVGYNLQVAPRWIVGVEGDVGFLSNSRSFCIISNNCSAPAFAVVATSKSDVVSTLRARAGFAAWDRALLYVTGGAAWVRVTDSWTDSTPPGSINQQSKTLSGWTGGGGIEAALAGNWTVKAEYLYIDAGTLSVVDSNGAGYFPSVEFKHRYHLARAGLNYRFGGGPVVARY